MLFRSLASNLGGYLLDADPNVRAQSQASFAAAIRTLAAQLKQRGAGIIISGPLPFFMKRPDLITPKSLCQPEWYRPHNNLPSGCKPTLVPRAELIDFLEPLNVFLMGLEKELPNVHVFNPFSSICPPDQQFCSTHRGEIMLFVDSNHLSVSGVRLLEQPFLDFLSRHDLNRPTARASATATHGKSSSH